MCKVVRCFLPKGRFFLSDAKFLCHVLFLSALRSQSHSLHLLASLYPVTLLLVFQEFSFPETFLRWPSVIRNCVLRHAQSNFSATFSKFPARSNFVKWVQFESDALTASTLHLFVSVVIKPESSSSHHKETVKPKHSSHYITTAVIQTTQQTGQLQWTWNKHAVSDVVTVVTGIKQQ